MQFQRFMMLLMVALFVFLGATALNPLLGQIVFYLMLGGLSVGLLLYTRWFQKFIREVNELIPYITTDPERYIRETEKLLEIKRASNVRAMLLLNIAVAHMEMNHYEKAKETLMSIRGGSLKKTSAHVYFLNMAYVYAQLGEHEKAMSLMDKYRKQFLSLPMGGNLPIMTGFMQVYELIQLGEWEQAKAHLLTTEENYPNKVAGVDFAPLKKQIYGHFNEEIPEIAPVVVTEEETVVEDSEN